MTNINNKKKSFRIPNILILLILGLLARLAISPFGTLSLDQNTFIAWSQRLAKLGLSKFYFGAWSDYLPGYLYILALLGKIDSAHLIPTVILYKLPAIISDLVTGFLIYKITLDKKDKKWAQITSALYIFNPAILANSALWGQVDSLTALFSILSIYFLYGNRLFSAISLAIGTLIKPQMAIISLPIFILMIRDNWKISKISTYALISGSVFVLGFVPFANNENLISFIFSRVTMSLNQYPYTSVNAFNLWAITGSWRSDTGLNIIGGAVAIIAFFAMAKKFQKKGEEYTLLAISYAASFLFMTRMHERHLLPIFAPLTISLASNPSFIFALIGFSFIYLANLYWAWNWITYTFKDVFGDFLVKTLSAVNILLLSFFVLPKKVSNIQSKTTQIIRKYQKLTQISKFEEFKKTPISSGIINLLFIAVILFASGTRFYNLNNPPKHYFDEVYHAFTAQEMLHGVTYAWEWWNPNPKDYAYEWTHPPLAKELMALSMKFLGETAFAWRFPGALLGTLSVIMIFFIAKEIFKDDLLALLSSAIFALDGLPLTLSRIGMNDSYVLFFSLACVYSYLKNKNLLASIFLGLSLASKWSGLWLVPIIFVIHFATKKKLKLSYFYFFLLPPLIYLSSYFPLFTNKQIQNEYVVNNYYEARTDKTGIIPLDMFIDTQKQMWWYHTRLKATHSYTSMWYTWPFSVRPVYLYTSEETKMEVSRIYAMGNPAIFWGGVLAISVSIFLAIKEKNKRLGIVVFSYLVFFVPWALSPRIMFLYHYLPSIPFMAIATAYILRRFDEWTSPFLILSFATFLYFYPHFSGTKIPIWLDSSYYWFKSWR